MYSDLFKAQQQRHELAILRRLFPESTADDVAAFLEVGERYSQNPRDRIEVVAVAARLLAEFPPPLPPIDIDFPQSR